MSKYSELLEKINSQSDSLTAIEKKLNDMTTEMVYNYVDDNLPGWCKAIVAALKHVGVLQGINEKGELGLKYADLRSLVINYRGGSYDKALSITRDEKGNITQSPIVQMFNNQYGLNN